MSGLTPATKRLAIFVVVACALAMYGGQWLKPRLTKLKDERTKIVRLSDQLEETRGEARVVPSNSARLAETYANELESQSTGQSLHEVLRACARTAGPEVTLKSVRFGRREAEGPLKEMTFRAELEGSYTGAVRMLNALDGVFPPIRLTRIQATTAGMSGDEEGAEAGKMMTTVEGVLHEPR